MQRYSNNLWRVSVYISDELAQVLNNERKKMKLSESGIVSAILEVVLLPDRVEQEGDQDAS